MQFVTNLNIYLLRNNTQYVSKSQEDINIMRDFKDIENRLKEIFKTTKSKEIADLLGASSGTYGNWKSRNTIPYNELVTLCEEKNINLLYVLTGKNKEENKQNVIDYEKEIHKLTKELNEIDLEKIYHTMKLKVLENK